MTRKTYGRNIDPWASNYVLMKIKVTPAGSLEYYYNYIGPLAVSLHLLVLAVRNELYQKEAFQVSLSERQ